MTHPANRFFGHSPEKRARGMRQKKLGASLLTVPRLADMAVQKLGQNLHAVANTENRDADLEKFRIELRGRKEKFLKDQGRL